jgi:23S rRNA pseudouridine2605 synthase
MPSKPSARGGEVRLQAYLARAGIASRRASEELIAQGRVFVNGASVTAPGTKVRPGHDDVQVDGKSVEQVPLTWIALHKPRGYVTTRIDQYGRQTVYDLLPEKFASLFHVGRLDRDSEGILLMTNDGDTAHLMLHPSYGTTKEYLADVMGQLSSEETRELVRGVKLEDGVAKAESVTRLHQVDEGVFRIRIVLREGKKREIRRMLESIGHPVRRLIRRRFGPVELGELSLGKWRVIGKHELDAVRNAKPRAKAADGSDDKVKDAYPRRRPPTVDEMRGARKATAGKTVDGERVRPSARLRPALVPEDGDRKAPRSRTAKAVEKAYETKSAGKRAHASGDEPPKRKTAPGKWERPADGASTAPRGRPGAKPGRSDGPGRGKRDDAPAKRGKWSEDADAPRKSASPRGRESAEDRGLPKTDWRARSVAAREKAEAKPAGRGSGDDAVRRPLSETRHERPGSAPRPSGDAGDAGRTARHDRPGKPAGAARRPERDDAADAPRGKFGSRGTADRPERSGPSRKGASSDAPFRRGAESGDAPRGKRPTRDDGDAPRGKRPARDEGDAPRGKRPPARSGAAYRPERPDRPNRAERSERAEGHRAGRGSSSSAPRRPDRDDAGDAPRPKRPAAPGRPSRDAADAPRGKRPPASGRPPRGDAAEGPRNKRPFSKDEGAMLPRSKRPAPPARGRGAPADETDEWRSTSKPGRAPRGEGDGPRGKRPPSGGPRKGPGGGPKRGPGKPGGRPTKRS